MRLFVWSIILTFLLLLTYAEVVSIVLPPPPHEDAHVLPVHKTLYIERNVYDDELFHIMEAALEWNQATDGQVFFDIKRLPRSNISLSNSLIIFNVTPDYPDIIILDNSRKQQLDTLGFFNDSPLLPHIELVDERISDQDYTAVVLHELGHYLGLEHPNDDDHPEVGIGSLMYSTIDFGSNHITKDDLKQFCQIYHCDASKFHGIPEVQ